MDRVFLPASFFTTEEARVTGPEQRHLAQSLRVRSGERFLATDGEGREYLLEAVTVSRRELSARIIEQSKHPPGPGARLTLAIAPPKGGRMEIAVEKAVECGVGRIAPVRTARSVVRGRENSSRVERWLRVAQSATAQSRRCHAAEILPMESFSPALAAASAGRVLIAHPGPEARSVEGALSGVSPADGVTIFVGPEGGFTEEELEEGRRFGATEVSLGANRLRTETAAIVAATLALSALSRR